MILFLGHEILTPGPKAEPALVILGSLLHLVRVWLKRDHVCGLSPPSLLLVSTCFHSETLSYVFSPYPPIPNLEMLSSTL